MIYQEQGAKVVFEDVTYEVGMRIIGSDASDYKGVNGRITEIRTGRDKETENDEDYPDIYCAFDVPFSPTKRKELEETFTELYGDEKQIEDITFDFVILGPDEIVVPGDNEGSELFVLTETFSQGTGPISTQCSVYTSDLIAKADFEYRLSQQIDLDGAIDWLSEDAVGSVMGTRCYVDPEKDGEGYFEEKDDNGTFYFLSLSRPNKIS